MKKIAVFLAAIAVSVSVLAGPPTKEINWFSNANDAENGTGIRRSVQQEEPEPEPNPTPIAPATLLLLGLGGAVVGGKVIRNRRKE